MRHGQAGGRRRGHDAVRLAKTVLSLLATLAIATAAQAHVGHQVQTAERYIKIDVSGYTGRVVVSLNTGATETLRLLRLADADGDQTVTEEERDAYLEAWRAGLATEVELRAGDSVVPLEWGDAFMSPIGPMQATSGSVEMVGRFTFAGGEVTLTLRDDMPQGGFERTDYSARVRDGATLLGAGLGRVDDGRDRFAIRRGDRTPGPFMVRVQAPLAPLDAPTGEESRTGSSSGLSGLQTTALGLVFAVVVLGLLSLRRSDRASHP